MAGMVGAATIYENGIVTTGLKGRSVILLRDVESFSLRVTDYSGRVSGRQVELEATDYVGRSASIKALSLAGQGDPALEMLCMTSRFLSSTPVSSNGSGQLSS